MSTPDPTTHAAEVAKQIAASQSLATTAIEIRREVEAEVTAILAPVLAGKDAELAKATAYGDLLDATLIGAEPTVEECARFPMVALANQLRTANAALAAERDASNAMFELVCEAVGVSTQWGADYGHGEALAGVKDEIENSDKRIAALAAEVEKKQALIDCFRVQEEGNIGIKAQLRADKEAAEVLLMRAKNCLDNGYAIQPYGHIGIAIKQAARLTPPTAQTEEGKQ